ncbi:MAG: acetyl-CoA carboxylase biotin carboxylase subunit, partial [Planctomycetes bacterium]|nr:acetyl-CoA carboxylase biotin carboxylase subunit [Planctomycetota bacterium]
LDKEQIRIAAGGKLKISQKDENLQGAAIECRINAEDPKQGFKPSPGKITDLSVPGGPGVRFDGHIYPGYEIPPFYDSMIGKLIVHRKTREEAIVAMKHALTEFVVEGVPTTIPFHLAVMDHTQFIRGQIDTTFVESYFGK